MAELEFNGESIEATPGETLVQAARRHGSHVWFLCDGRGICQTCECRVVSGAASLSEPSQLERAGLGQGKLGRGWRLGCQAMLAGPGPVSVMSRAEELRRSAGEVVSGTGTRTRWESLGRLGAETLAAASGLMAGVAIMAPFALPQLLLHPPTPARMANYARDGLRVAGALWRRGWLAGRA